MAPGSRCSGHQVAPVFTSCSTSWRWLKVPRSTSCPVNRSGTPSVSRLASASASACAQSMPPSGPSAGRRRSSCFASFGFTVKSAGYVSSCSLSALSSSAATARVDFLAGDHLLPGFRRGALPGARLERLLDLDQALVRRRRERIGLVTREHALGHQLAGVLLPHRRQRLDALVHQRLGVGRLVALVVAVAAVADQVDQHVALELLPVGHREPDGARGRPPGRRR